MKPSQSGAGPRLSAETMHASAVASGGRAVLISGPSGAGKSDLALRLLDRILSERDLRFRRLFARERGRRPSDCKHAE